MVTDHTMIKPGALHRANGGFLVVQALDVLTQPLVWETLKRALRTRQLRLENMGEQFSIIPTASLSPEPIPLEREGGDDRHEPRLPDPAERRRGLPEAVQGEGRLHDRRRAHATSRCDCTRASSRGRRAELGMRPFDRERRRARRRAELADGRRPGEALAADDGHRRPARRGRLLGVRRGQRDGRRRSTSRRRSSRRSTART